MNKERNKLRKEKFAFEKSKNFIDFMEINKETLLPTKLPEYEKIVCISEVVVHYAIANLLEKIKKSKLGFTYEYGIWTFSLLLLLEKPLVPDVCAELNELLGYIIECRENRMDQTEICDLLIVIIAEYFGQRPM